ncbi:hypothetical protein EVJ58_g9957 [Rhodofomes roseus]|uniref:Uncharacterized protein n=1 Tax=Rhodofomes roseus TaxID=34475 RepID=A0A4Y9XR46_9APHY|nr:hypothetical protein EVJ58_g9957 [Rhodofomes roseus]
MPTTRRQAAQQNGTVPTDSSSPKVASRARKTSTKKNARVKNEPITVGEKREQEESEVKAEEPAEEGPPAKKPKTEAGEDEMSNGKTDGDEGVKQESDSKQSDGKADHPAKHAYQTGTIERGHIYFFYRPKVELDEAHSVDDVQRFYILLVPRPPEFSVASNGSKDTDEDQEMTVLFEGADAVPAPEPKGQTKKHFRLIVPGKKSLPDPEHGRGRGNIFWGAIVTIGEDLNKLQQGLGGKEYETKTRGTRHQAAARLAARGAYAIVNNEAQEWGEVQAELGLHPASSFVLQVKNPLAPPTGPGRVGLPKSRTVDYPEYIMTEVFGKGGGRGREDFGLRFSSVERKEMLDYEGVELLFIAARSGESGLETSLGEGRGKALEELEEKEGRESVEEVFKELAMDADKIPADPLGGQWA